MQIIHHLQIDLAQKLPQSPVEAVQGDGNTRTVKLSLLENSAPWEVPEGVTAAVAFRKPDGHRGLYDTLPDSNAAITVDGSTVTVVLAPQVLTCVGTVYASIVFHNEALDQLATFPFEIRVERNPAAGMAVSNDYYSYTTMATVNDAIAAVENALNAAQDHLDWLTGATAIICEASGSSLVIDGTAEAPLQDLTLYGRTTQSGTPSPDAPVELESIGVGSITVTCGFTPNYTKVVLSTPNGLPGIPVDEGGSYTDADGQQWLADEKDFARGVYVQRVGSHTVTDADVGTQFQDGCVQLINPTDFLYQKGTPMLCDRFVNNREAYCDGISTAALYLSDGEFSNRYWETSTARFLYFKSSLFTDLATAKAWFAANETVVLYPLAEPVETAIPEEEMAAYYAPRTAYPASLVKNDAGAYMHLKYVADTKLYIDKKLADISAAMLNT